MGGKLLLFSLIVALLYTLGDNLATRYFEYKQSSLLRLIGGVALNGLGVILFGYVASRGGVGVSSGIMLALNITLNTILGIYLFHDHITVGGWVGLSLCFLGVVVATIFNQ